MSGGSSSTGGLRRGGGRSSGRSSSKGDYIGAESGSPYGYRDPDCEALEMHLGFRYGCQEIVRRLRAEPNLLPASIRAMHADDTMDREDRIEMLRAEADHSLVREVMTLTPDTWDEISEEAQHQVFGYLVKSMIPVGGPASPHRSVS